MALFVTKRVTLLLMISAIVAGLFYQESKVELLPLFMASALLFIWTPGAYFGGRELDKQKLEKELSLYWKYEDILAEFIVHNWYAIKYFMSSQSRGENSTFMGSLIILYAIWLFFNGASLQVLAWSISCGLALLVVGLKISAVFNILKYKHNSMSWNLACISLLACSKILKNENYELLVYEQLPRNDIQIAIERYKKNEKNY